MISGSYTLEHLKSHKWPTIATAWKECAIYLCKTEVPNEEYLPLLTLPNEIQLSNIPFVKHTSLSLH